MSSNVAQFPTLPFSGIVFFNPYVNSYTGAKKLTPEDLGLRSSDLPPQDLATLGSMHTCDPRLLQPFESARNRQRNACLEWGTKLMGAFAVPEDKALLCAKRLDEISAEFYAYKQEFLAEFQTTREEWITRPEFSRWTDQIRRSLHPVEYLDKQIQCGWHAFTVADVGTLPKMDGEDVPSLGASQIAVAHTVGDSALDDIAVAAAALLRDSLNDDNGNARVEVTQKILGPIRRMRDKLDGLAFADPKLVAIVRYINDVIGMLPQKGKLTGTHLAVLRGLIVALGDPRSIVETAKFARHDVVVDAADAQAMLAFSPEVEGLLPSDFTPVEDDLDGGNPLPPSGAVSTADATGEEPVQAVSSSVATPSSSVTPLPVAEPLELAVYDDL